MTARWWSLAVILAGLLGCAEGSGNASLAFDSGGTVTNPAADAGDASALAHGDSAQGEDADDGDGGADGTATADAPPFDELDGAVSSLDVAPGLDGHTGMDASSVCGDGVCVAPETCTSCPADCGACLPMCGDGTCNGIETCTSCPADCGACPPTCGDGTCNGVETCSTCPTDCGACPSDCAGAASCGACTAEAACGWCEDISGCFAGTAAGPNSGVCSSANWAWSTAACMTSSDPCAGYGDCFSCALQDACAWCEDTNGCVSLDGTAADECFFLDIDPLDCI